MARDGGGSFAAGSVALAGNLSLPNTTAGFAAGGISFGGLSLPSQLREQQHVPRKAGRKHIPDGRTQHGRRGAGAHLEFVRGPEQRLRLERAAFNTTGGGNAAFGATALHLNSREATTRRFGNDALFHNTASGNAAFGRLALTANTTGTNEAAFGHNALLANTVGNANAAFGANALQANVAGAFNTAVGSAALFSSTGNSNTAVGSSALNLLTSGGFNIAIGSFAGTSLTSGTNNIYVGADAGGDESNVIRIGSGQTATVIAGIYGAAIGGSGLAVSVNSSGQLGTTSSSRRYKDEIVDIADESDVLMQLRPVAFYYKTEYDPTHTRQYGLIAEEVAEVAPGLVARDKDGRIETVRYPLVNAMLLNEVQKSRRLVEELRADRDDLRRRLEVLEARASREPARPTE